MSRTIVVTGAASGIGQATAKLLTAAGDRVIEVDQRDVSIQADLASAAGRRAAVQAITDRAEGSLDGVVACAGTSVPSALMVRVNYFGTVELVEAVQPLLAASGAGRVAVVGSISGTRPNHEALIQACLAGDEEAAVRLAGTLETAGTSQLIYPSTKNALAQWARRTAIAPGWADAAIPVNVVAPGVVLTPMSAGLFDDPQMKQVMDQAVPMPLNSYAPAAAPAALLSWLVSEQNTHVTGQVIYVDGGAEVTLRPSNLF